MPASGNANATTSAPDLVTLNKDNLARVIGFADLYDSKAKFVLTVVLAITGYFLTELTSFITMHAMHATDPWFVLLDIVAASCLGFFLTAVFFIVWTIRPNTNQHSQKKSPFFFQSIASYPLDEFKAVMTTLTESSAITFLAEQTYDNAKVVTRKDTIVRRSFNCFIIGTVCFLLFSIGRAIVLALY